MNLKKSLFTIAFLHSTVALVLSVLSFWGCMELNAAIAPQGAILEVYSNPMTMIEMPAATATAMKLTKLISIFQIALPILIYTLALLSTASSFYRLKLKEPLEILAEGASRIIDNDLNFTIEVKSQDELGQLCAAFETMRKALLENNRELWRQAEERKRLNAAFSHNLRNPVTVLKGSTKLARKGVEDGTAGTAQIAENLSRMESYTNRIERYIETMSSIQKLEEIPVKREIIPWDSLISELKDMLYLVGLESDKHINFVSATNSKSVLIDKSILFQIVENLISNSLRFAAQNIDVFCSINEMIIELSIMDDGCGFPAALIKNGIQPFQKGNEDIEHFGMGLYICKLLCQRHGGSMAIKNQEIGAAVSATLKIQ